jgi:hypothetical protein
MAGMRAASMKLRKSPIPTDVVWMQQGFLFLEPRDLTI